MELIAQATQRYEGRDLAVLSEFRYRALERAQQYLHANGWPETREDRFALSLVPLIFQEANYDDIDWGDQGASLGRLEWMFSIDVLVQSKGRARAELNEDEFSEYIELSMAAIDSRRR